MFPARFHWTARAGSGCCGRRREVERAVDVGQVGRCCTHRAGIEGRELERAGIRAIGHPALPLVGIVDEGAQKRSVPTTVAFSLSG